MPLSPKQATSPLVILGVSGSIAAYKAAELTRLMVKAGYTVRVVMTQAATRFVGELTFRVLSQYPVFIDMFEQPTSWEPAHVAWGNQACAMVVAPCTANVMAKLAHGIADEPLSAVALATAAPLLLAPAMNTAMWRHPATQHNLSILRKRGTQLVKPGTGELACGDSGEGRMAEPAEILAALQTILKPPS